jgi:hypothetical protein
LRVAGRRAFDTSRHEPADKIRNLFTLQAAQVAAAQPEPSGDLAEPPLVLSDREPGMESLLEIGDEWSVDLLDIRFKIRQSNG